MTTSAAIALGVCILGVTGLSAHADSPARWGPVVITLTGEEAEILDKALPCEGCEHIQVLDENGNPEGPPPPPHTETETVTIVCPPEQAGQQPVCVIRFEGAHDY